MTRRMFIWALSLPFITPVARAGQRIYLRVRPPKWSVCFDVEIDQPTEVEITCGGVTAKRILLPTIGRQTISIPMWHQPLHTTTEMFSMKCSFSSGVHLWNARVKS